MRCFVTAFFCLGDRPVEPQLECLEKDYQSGDKAPHSTFSTPPDCYWSYVTDRSKTYVALRRLNTQPSGFSRDAFFFNLLTIQRINSWSGEKSLNNVSALPLPIARAIVGVIAFVCFLSANVHGQIPSTTESITDAGNGTTPPSVTKPNPTRVASKTTLVAVPQADDEVWRFEIRPYIWFAGIDGTLRVGNLTAETGRDSSDILGVLDFAAAGQLEAIKGRWRVMIDENYVNLGTTGTGPLGNISVDVEPTLNIFEAGGSFTAVTVNNKKATAAEPLPPVFSAEILGGVRWFHLGLGLEPSVGNPVEGSRNFFGPFVGNRFKVSPHKAVTLIGKYTVGGSGAGSNFAWSAEGLVDLRLKKGFSVGGGYRALGMNTDEPSNRVGFNGTLKGLLFTLTLYR